MVIGMVIGVIVGYGVVLFGFLLVVFMFFVM